MTAKTAEFSPAARQDKWRPPSMQRVFVLPALLLIASTSAAAPKPEAAKFGWHTDYAEAKAEAKRTGKPIFLVFRCEP